MIGSIFLAFRLIFKEIILGIDENDGKNVQKIVAYCRKQKVSQSELEKFQRED